MDAWRGIFRTKRLAVWVVLAATGILIALLATGVLSKHTGGSEATTPTTAPTITTSTSGGQAETASGFGPGDWATYGGTFDEIRHSPLTQIDTSNVDTLERVATIDFRRIDPSIPKGQQSFPIVINGIIYVTTSNDHVFAINGGSGKEIWEFTPTNTGVFADYGVNANRGVAYCDGNLYLLTLDMRIDAIDASTGKLVNEVPISAAVPGALAQYSYSETQAPICYKNTLIIGASGSDYGVRGFVMAYHTDLTAAWSSPYWIVPPDDEEWRSAGNYTGGGTNWNPVTIDSTDNILYATTSNPSPIFDPQIRPGPDPRTDSIVALDLSTGRQVWWQQQIPGDQWGYSTSQPVLLYNVKIGGHKERVVSVATKEGTWWMYNAKTGAPIYEHVKLLNQLEHPALKPGVAVTVYPSSLGGLNYSPSSFDPKTGYVINNQAETSVVLQEQKNPAAVNKYKIKGDVSNGLEQGTFGYTPTGWHDYGSVTAINAAKGTIAWKYNTPEPGRGGITTTASGLSFAPGGDGVLRAFNTANGELLWSFQTGHQLAAAPSIYEVNGTEYLAITVGGTATSSDGGTASELEIFALKGGSTTQSPAPALRPQGAGPGVLHTPSEDLSLSAAPHTLELQVVASEYKPNGADTIDETAHGSMTVEIPQGWAVNVSFVNHALTRKDGVALVSSPSAAGGAPVFKGAETAKQVPGPGIEYFEFNAATEGNYVLASQNRAQAAGGEWIHFDVVKSNAPPELLLPNQQFAVVAASGAGLNG
jgi:alcohol dehydrogenase (cytochrome c)